jgi:SAM-dependent methyltransferase
LTLAQMGAEVTGLDFSTSAIAAAQGLAAELGLPARFIVSDLYDAPATLPEPAGFDIVFATWGTLCWLPDIAGWARVAAHFVKPGGVLYLADGHPAAYVFDDDCALPSGLPGYFLPYFHQGPLVQDDPRDYADPAARIEAARTYQYAHPLGRIVTEVMRQGLALEFLHEHDAVPWRMFSALVDGGDRMFRWPDKAWLPLAFSLRARK